MISTAMRSAQNDRPGQVADVKLQIVKVPMLDTGIGRAAGFRDDAHLIEVAQAERAAMPAWQRELMDEADRRLEDAVINGA